MTHCVLLIFCHLHCIVTEVDAHIKLDHEVNLCRSNLCEPKEQRKCFFLLLALYYAKEKPHPLDVLCLGGVANEIEVRIKGGCFSNEELLKQLVLDSDWKIKTNHLDSQKAQSCKDSLVEWKNKKYRAGNDQNRSPLTLSLATQVWKPHYSTSALEV